MGEALHYIFTMGSCMSFREPDEVQLIEPPSRQGSCAEWTDAGGYCRVSIVSRIPRNVTAVVRSRDSNKWKRENTCVMEAT
jgi:hypothetical protein